jgi:hypothetical protein
VSEPLVLALVADEVTGARIAAGFEEEGVPVTVRTATAAAVGTADALARAAAGQALLGIGIGGDGERLALVLAGASGRAYLEAPVAAARAFGHRAARVAARRPLTRE